MLAKNVFCEGKLSYHHHALSECMYSVRHHEMSEREREHDDALEKRRK